MPGAPIALAALLLSGAPARAVPIAFAASGGPDGNARLQIVQGKRKIDAPKTEEGQEGFSQALVAPDGRTLGWVALTGNCCTSYPLPTVLVLFRDGKVLRRFEEAPPIWAWAFAHGSTEVVYRRAPPYGMTADLYSRRRVSDGRVLAEFSCIEEDPAPRVPFPVWTMPVAEACPDAPPPAADAPSTPETAAPAVDAAASGPPAAAAAEAEAPASMPARRPVFRRAFARPRAAASDAASAAEH